MEPLIYDLLQQWLNLYIIEPVMKVVGLREEDDKECFASDWNNLQLTISSVVNYKPKSEIRSKTALLSRTYK